VIGGRIDDDRISAHPCRMTPKMPDPYVPARDAVLRTVLDGPGETDPSLRHAAAEGVAVPEELKTLVEKIHRHPYKVTDEDIEALQKQYGDDQLFEIIVSATLGAARQRLMAGLKALEDA
jgi:alkylhydroperoxidase family enzyme